MSKTGLPVDGASARDFAIRPLQAVDPGRVVPADQASDPDGVRATPLAVGHPGVQQSTPADPGRSAPRIPHQETCTAEPGTGPPKGHPEQSLPVKSGAAIIHLHVRGDDGEECLDPDRYYEAISKIREASPDVIIEIAPRATDTLAKLPEKMERGNLVKISSAMWGNRPELKPEMCALNISTRNIDDKSFILNPPADVRAQIECVYDLGLTPRCDVYDLGDIRVALEFLEKGIVRAPLHFLLILGSYSGIGATVENLDLMVNQLPDGSHWTALGAGSRHNSTMAEHAIAGGGNIRTGFEDETYIRKGQKAESNAQLVERFGDLCERLDRAVATPAEARKLLGLQHS